MTGTFDDADALYNPELASDEISVREEREFTTIMMTEIKLLRPQLATTELTVSPCRSIR
jgi:hypothetical protein